MPVEHKESHPEGWLVAVKTCLTTAVAEDEHKSDYTIVNNREVPKRE